MLKIYNSLGRAKEVFKPLQAGLVKMYVCGITAYDYCHLGHARVMVVFDMIVRYLRACGYDVHYVRNITDIDDKIILRASELGESVQYVTDRYISAMQEDFAALNILPVDVEPKATEHISEIIAMIEQIFAHGYAYQGSNQDIYFAVNKFSNYGRLSGRHLADLRAGARVAVNEAKIDPLDFVLWKHAKEAEPYWESPWGRGRPGWHIECSAMACHCLGEHFDIHGGGQDLQFPHHENEIAQSVSANGGDFANYWIHNGFVKVAEQKMSKSLDNFFTIRELLQHTPSEAIRFFILSSHYRSPLNYTLAHLRSAHAALAGLYAGLRDWGGGDAGLDSPDLDCELDQESLATFHAAMEDDFNSPQAIAVLHDLAARLRQAERSSKTRNNIAVTLRHLGGILGLLQDAPEAFLQAEIASVCGEHIGKSEIEAIIAKRAAARAQGDYAKADSLRQQLSDLGVALEDSTGGTKWHRLR